MRYANFLVSFLLASASVCSLHASSIIDDFSAANNDRFANDSSFVAGSYDLSGVAISQSKHWATLVSGNVILSANHYDPYGDTVAFYPDNDPNSTPITRNVTGQDRVGSTDLWMGVLNEPVPGSINYYSYATENVTESHGQSRYQNSDYYEQNAYLFRRSDTADDTYGSDKTTDMVVGRNKLDVFVEDSNLESSSGDVIATSDIWGAIDNDSGDSNYVTYETYLQPGDSGGPMFVDVNGTFTLVGLNAGIGENLSTMTYVGNYSDSIASYIAANPVPEPGMVTLLIGAAACVMRRRNIRFTP